MIQELEDLKNSILEQRYEDALALIYQLDGMSRQAKINAIESFVIRMLIVHKNIVKYDISLFCRCYSDARVSVAPPEEALQHHASCFKSGDLPNALASLSHGQRQKGAAFLIIFKEPLTSALINPMLAVRYKPLFTLFPEKVT
ncbi:MAG: hypothetical protein F6K48_34025 [Okeania sp. SIO3H1]|uniref:hypothetical protein n=1 Tax=Okeania sp. SIO1I7 TaxID=2607772 RepID=UPI0013C73763|nr:hypothetical protein [Okeania sp. SIO1I7]NEN93622.1 hypothetical protein [Okeania sp. SIO3H1]NET26547.1 hypothetical protein [Okeania sp. SIO1I7]